MQDLHKRLMGPLPAVELDKLSAGRRTSAAASFKASLPIDGDYLARWWTEELFWELRRYSSCVKRSYTVS